jgi:hypothetical protein
VLFALIVAAVLAAPLYASQIAGTTPSENHLTEQTVIDGTPTDIVSLEGIPIGPTWEGSYLLGADENGRDLAVRLLYGARSTPTAPSTSAWYESRDRVRRTPVRVRPDHGVGRVDHRLRPVLDCPQRRSRLLARRRGEGHE